jgi:apolipoprotein D and lipocalin family protein
MATQLKIFMAAFCFSCCFSLISVNKAMALETVKEVQIEQYLGEWFEVFRLPNEFQDNTNEGFGTCFNTTAEYGLLEDGRISVLNTCYRSDNQKTISEVARGKARVVDPETNAKLKVNFTGNPILEALGIGDGDYWILDLGPVNNAGQYSHSLVGAPSMEYLWLLSRTSSTEQSVVDAALSKAKELGFDVSKVRFSR